MRSVLAIFGIAIAALAVAMLIQKPKDLSPAPQFESLQKTEADQREAANKQRQQHAVATEAAAKAQPPLPAVTRQNAITAVMTIAGRGDITLELYPKAAPKTVAQFVKLAKSGFYNGIKFHRVVPDFVVQAGDPKSKSVSTADLLKMSEDDVRSAGLGASGSGTPIPFESNSLTHTPGSIAMALSGPRSDTGDSQFFINLKPNDQLNGDYCVFGRVTAGMKVVASIVQGDAITKITTKP